MHVLKRYAKFNLGFIEEFIEYLVELEKYDLAAVYLTKVLNDEGFNSPTGKSKY